MAINLSGISLTSDVTGGGGVSGGVTAKMKFIPVTTLPAADEASKTAVYLVPAKNATTKNKYDEYVVLQTENGYIWELFGQDVSVDLQSFATKTELAKKQDKLVNQQNIRSINNVPILGAGNVNFEVFSSAAEKKKVLDFVNNGGGGGMTEEEREKLTELDLKVGELGDFLTNEEIDDIFLGGLKIVDGMLVGSGELEGDTYTISGLNVEDGVAII